YDEPAFIQLWAERIRAGLTALAAANVATPGGPHALDSCEVLFSAHSLPERILAQKDPYPDQLLDSAAAIARAAGVSQWRFAYQSAGRTPEPWLGPDILDVLPELQAKGRRLVLSCPIGFVATHLEVIYDIDIEAQARAKELGLRLVRAEMPDADPAFTAMLAQLILRRLGS
ncbi:MAG TPA: ferrochelatase, partial [Limnochordia bacterium]|nr:ferrochelatase [Limnochordia bacterium]